MLTPTDGFTKIGGIDVAIRSSKARAELGYCPERDILFNDLTVSEHLEYFGKVCVII